MYISICNNIFFSSVSDECCATEFWIVYWAVNSSQHSVHTNTPAHRESQWNESSCISTELVIWHYKPLWIIQPQREAIDERRAGGGGDFKGEEALGKEEEKHRGGIVTIKPAESIVREKLCVCVSGDTRAPLCCPVQMPVHQHRAAVPDSAASPSVICPEESS